MKMKLQGRRQKVSSIQRKLPAVLGSFKENNFHGAFETWEKRKRWDYCICILKEMATKVE
jgi:hypothetical protein